MSTNADDLVSWLDTQVRQPDIASAQLRTYLKAVVAYLRNEQRLSIASLTRSRYQLAQSVAARIEDIRRHAEGRFRQLVLDGGWQLATDPVRSFAFLPGNYAVPASSRYRGK